jgi:hypothetical protein
MRSSLASKRMGTRTLDFLHGKDTARGDRSGEEADNHPSYADVHGVPASREDSSRET